MIPFPSKEQIERGDYPKWDRNDWFERECLKALGLPQDFHPTEEQGQRIVNTVLDE